MTAHGVALGELADRLFPAIATLNPALRRKLAALIERHTAAVTANLRSDLVRAAGLIGRRFDPIALRAAEPVAIAAQERRTSDLLGLVEALRGPGALALDALSQELVAALQKGMELGQGPRTEPLSSAELATLAESDSAFRFLHYLLEIVEQLSTEMGPRSLLALRGGKK